MWPFDQRRSPRPHKTLFHLYRHRLAPCTPSIMEYRRSEQMPSSVSHFPYLTQINLGCSVKCGAKNNVDEAYYDPKTVKCGAKTMYSDSWLDLMAINYVSRNLQAVSEGIVVEEEGYMGLVETCKLVTLKYSPLQQR